MNQHAQKLGSLGGKARAKKLTKEQLRDIAMKGVEARKLKKQNENNYEKHEKQD